MEKPQQTKEKIAAYIPIDITPKKKRFCNACGSELLSDYSCGKCAIFYRPEEAKHEIRVVGLDGKEPGLSTTTIPIASVDTTPSQKRKKMAPLFESLEKSGFRFTSYSSTNEP